MKLSNLFRPPSASQLAQAELDEARRELLVACGALDYAIAMVDYHQARIDRLEAMLKREAAGA